MAVAAEGGSKRVIRRKADNARRESLVKVLLTEGERARFQVAADAMGLSLSAWMRTVAHSVTKPGTGKA